MTSLPKLYNVLHAFFQILGLSINLAKTAAFNVGLTHDTTKLLALNFQFQWKENSLPILGIRLTKSYETLYQVNYSPLYRKLSKLLEDWGKYHISWIGRIWAIK